MKKKVWLVLLVVLVVELLFAYSGDIVKAVTSWFEFTLELNTVESSEEPSAEFAMYMDADCTMPYSDCGNKSIWSAIEQGQPLYWDRYVKNIGDVGASVSLAFSEDVSDIMTYQFEPDIVFLEPGEVYLFTLNATILPDAPVGVKTIPCYGY